MRPDAMTCMSPADRFAAQGWLAFGQDAAVETWAASVLPAARRAVSDPANAFWLRCGGTWFVGVDALPNDASGRVDGGPPLDGAAMRFIRSFPEMRRPLHRAQLSVCYPAIRSPRRRKARQPINIG